MEKGIRLTSEEERVIISGKAIDIMGLSKREWLAGMAMQGLLAKSSGDYIDEQRLADFSVICADELIKQLEKDV